MRSFLLTLALGLASLGKGWAVENPQGGTGGKTVVIDIPSDLPAPPSAEEVVPLHPFFNSPSTGSEAMEYIRDLEERLSILEKRVQALEKSKT